MLEIFRWTANSDSSFWQRLFNTVSIWSKKARLPLSLQMIRPTNTASTVLREVPVQLCLLEKRSWSPFTNGCDQLIILRIRAVAVFSVERKQNPELARKCTNLWVFCRYCNNIVTRQCFWSARALACLSAQRWLSNLDVALNIAGVDNMSRIYQVQFRLVIHRNTCSCGQNFGSHIRIHSEYWSKWIRISMLSR